MAFGDDSTHDGPALPGSRPFDSVALGGGGSAVRLGGIGAAPGCGGGGLASPCDAVPVVAATGVCLAFTVVMCVAVGVGVSMGPAGLAPGCGAGYGNAQVGGGAVVVVASGLFGVECGLGSLAVSGVTPSAFAALTGL